MNTHRNMQIGPPKFSIAVHALCGLAKSEGMLSSAVIANQVNSHATFLRRVLALLMQSDIVEAKEGRDGGYYLKRTPDQITLADVFMAVKGECNEPEVQLDCGAAGKLLDAKLETIMGEVERRTVELLKQHTLADLMKDINITI